MSKEDFLEQVSAPPEMAEKAWEVAEGDEDYAQQLLDPHKLYIKGKFMDGGNKFGGLFFILWNYRENKATEFFSIVAGADNLMELPLDTDPVQFSDRLSLELKSGSRMSGNTEVFQEALSKALVDQDSYLLRSIHSGDLGELEPAVKEILVDSLDVRSPVVNIRPVVTRQIEEMGEPAADAPAEQPQEEDRYELPSEVEINPTRGIPLHRVQIGDLIYVDLGNVTGENVKFVKPLNKRRDETGLIPARLVSRESTEAGTLKLVVKFAQNVYGVTRSSKDLSILVPPETVSARAFEAGGFDPLEFVEENWVVLLTVLIAAAIILVAQTLIF